jgi:hypothetical protein
MELVILVGVRLAATHAHVSKDNFRSNPRPARRQRRLVAEAFAAGRSVAVDNTNPTAADRAELVALARAAGAGVVCYFFPPDVAASLRRNAAREGKARVPDRAVRITAARLEPPAPAEGFDRLYHVRIVEGGGFEVTPLYSLRENAITKEPGASYPERRRCASRLGASMVAQTPSSLPRR